MFGMSCFTTAYFHFAFRAIACLVKTKVAFGST